MYVADNYNLDDPSKMPVIQALDEQAGVTTEWEMVKQSNWDTQINLILSDPESWPDVVIASGKMDYEKYGVEQGMLVPLDDLIAEYMPNYTEQINMCETDPTVSLVASDGKTYALGYLVPQNCNTDRFFYLNKVWMNNLGLKTPGNIEELTEVLRAFKSLG